MERTTSVLAGKWDGASVGIFARGKGKTRVSEREREGEREMTL